MRDKMKSQDDGGGRAPAIFVFVQYALLTLLALLAAPFARAAVTVTNVVAAQQPGTKLMDITYDVSNSVPYAVTVSLIVSNGATAVSAPSLSGAIGAGVANGTGKAGVWNAGADWNGNVASLNYTVRADWPPDGMAFITNGTFTMGDVADTNSAGDAAPIKVSVSAFYMDQNDVTYALWQQVYNWAITNGYNFDNAGAGKATNQPVYNVDWYDCVKWCNARSELAGLPPAYYTDSTQTVVYRTGTNNLANVCVNWTAGYRLPTEAEWEKAARGGLSGQRFPWGATISESQANYDSSSAYFYDLSNTGFNPTYATGSTPYTSPAGAFAPNGYGLYDMAGNMWQWCWDWYGPYAGGSDPRGSTTGTDRVYRGGTWENPAYVARTAFRSKGFPYDGSKMGFRSVLPPR